MQVHKSRMQSNEHSWTPVYVNLTALCHAVMKTVIMEMFNIMVRVAKCPSSFPFFYIINANLSDCCLLVYISYPKNTSLAHRSAAKVAQVKRVDCVTFSTVGLGCVAQHWQPNNTCSSNWEMLGGRWKKNTVCKLLTQFKYFHGSRFSPPQQALELVDLPNEKDKVKDLLEQKSGSMKKTE